jgi:hypothetical protein
MAYRQYELRDRTVHSYGLKPGDAGTGTDTNKGTRQYVNDPNTPVPAEVGFAYAGANGVNGHGGFMNTLGNNTTYDAGHILGRQNGGAGHVNEGVFPQNRQINQGHAGTFDTWRRHEDNVNKTLKGGHDATWSVTLHDHARKRYDDGNQPAHDPGYFGNWGDRPF